MDEWNNPWTPEYQELRDRVPLPAPELSSVLPLAEDEGGAPFYWCPDCYVENAVRNYKQLREMWEAGEIDDEPKIDEVATPTDLWDARAHGAFCNWGHDL